MPPIDIPNVTADVASVKASHTSDVTGDVVNDSHGHTDVIVIEDLDVTVDVVN